MATSSPYYDHLYGVEFLTARGSRRVARVRADSISGARIAARSAKQPGEEMFSIWLIG